MGREGGIGLIACGCCCVGLGWWFGIFFGLTYPEIRRETLFEPASCNTTSTYILPFRSCSVSSGSCSGSTGGLLSCSSLRSQDASIPETDVSEATMSSLTRDCEGGSCCLRERCETCRDCREVCTGSSDSRSCRQECTSRECNCVCVEYGNYRNRHVCRIRYRLYVTLIIEKASSGDVRNRGVSTTYTEEYDSLGAAMARESEPHLRPTAITLCFVDPDWKAVPTIARSEVAYEFEMGYSPGMWVALFFPSFCLICVCVGAVQSCFNTVHTAVLLWTLWVGVLIPFAILMPIAFDSDVPAFRVTGLWSSIMALAALGWSPVLLAVYQSALSERIYDTTRQLRVAMASTLTFVTLPIAVGGPIVMSVGSGGELVGAYLGACLVLYIISLLLYITPFREMYVRARLTLGACLSAGSSWVAEARVRGFQLEARCAPRDAHMPPSIARDPLVILTRYHFDCLWNAGSAKDGVAALRGAFDLASRVATMGGRSMLGVTFDDGGSSSGGQAPPDIVSPARSSAADSVTYVARTVSRSFSIRQKAALQPRVGVDTQAAHAPAHSPPPGYASAPPTNEADPPSASAVEASASSPTTHHGFSAYAPVAPASAYGVGGGGGDAYAPVSWPGPSAPPAPAPPSVEASTQAMTYSLSSNAYSFGGGGGGGGGGGTSVRAAAVAPPPPPFPASAAAPAQVGHAVTTADAYGNVVVPGAHAYPDAAPEGHTYVPPPSVPESSLSGTDAVRNAGVWKYLRDELRVVGLGMRAEHASWWAQLRPAYVSLQTAYGEQTSTNFLGGRPMLARAATKRFTSEL